MRKILVLIASVLTVFTVVFSGCAVPAEPEQAETPEEIPEVLTEEYIRSLPPLCSKSEIKEVDFSVLKEVDDIVRDNSVFNSPFFQDIFGDTKKDQSYLMRAARDTLFCGFLSVPKSRIPQWAIRLVEEEISSGRYDYKVFGEIYQMLAEEPDYEYLNSSSQKEKLVNMMIEGMIKALEDPFTHHFAWDEWILAEKGSTEGNYRGVGVNCQKNQRGEIVITGVTSGSAAEKAGLKPGDVVLAVDEKSTLDCTINQFIVHIKTRENPKIELIIRRSLTEELERVTVVMEEIKVQALFTGPGVNLPNGRGSTAENLAFYYPLRDRDEKEHSEILYISIREFTVQMAADPRYVLGNIDIQKFKGIIIDVRDNPGGRVDATLDCVDCFLPGAELITTIKWGNGAVTEYRQNKWNFVPEDMPIVILVNQHTASGAEVFSSALCDNGRAAVFGRDERTSGKGSVNSYFELKKGEYGALYVSIGLWYTPLGKLVEKMDLDKDGYYEVGGLEPDVLVEWTNKDIVENQRNPAFYDPTLFRAIDYIQESE